SAAKRALDVRSSLAMCTEHIPRTPYGMEKRASKVVIDLLAQATHVHVDHIGLGVEMVVPHVLEEHRTSDHLVAMAHKILEQAKFAGLDVKRTAGASHSPAGKIHFKVVDPQHFVPPGRRTATAKRFDPSGKLGEYKRLGEIVVGA